MWWTTPENWLIHSFCTLGIFWATKYWIIKLSSMWPFCEGRVVGCAECGGFGRNRENAYRLPPTGHWIPQAQSIGALLSAKSWEWFTTTHPFDGMLWFWCFVWWEKSIVTKISWDSNSHRSLWTITQDLSCALCTISAATGAWTCEGWAKDLRSTG